jgi:UDP-N-acetylmuramyl pentapeptide phosphotransferase/UDP-N-acetylglucosamine-1-phosphate transferase
MKKILLLILECNLNMILAGAAFLTSLAITFFAIPSIIKIAQIKHLFDVPDERKTHESNVPTLGGIAIFAGMIFSITFWSSQKEIVELQYIISAIIILFFIGIKDDLFNLVAYKKLLGQLAAAFILVHFADIRITNFFGIFGVNQLSLVASYFFSIFTMVVITNSLNLIDGIDCLAGSVGILAASIFGAWFFIEDQTQYVVLSASLVGSLAAFLHYNRTPAKIFMGDTGSLLVGILLSILAIKFIEMNRIIPIDGANKIRGIPVVTIGILIIPLFDTLRSFTIRMLQGRSPFSPDRNHLHHLLIDLGLTHIKATLALVGFNILIVGIVFGAQKIRSEIVLTLILGLCLISSYILAYYRNKKKRIGILKVIPSSMNSDKVIEK